MNTRKKIIVVLLILVFSLCDLIMLAQTIYRALIYSPSDPEAFGEFPVQAVWSFTAQEQITCTPVVQDSIAFIATSHKLYAISIQDGTEVWEVEHSSSELCPYASDKTVIQPYGYGAVVAYETETGHQIWEDPFEGNGLDSIIFSENKVFVSRMFSLLSAYDSQNGALLWYKETPGHTGLPLSFGNDMLYMGVLNSVDAYDANTGRLRWSEDFGNSVIDIWLEGDLLYVNIDPNNTAIIAYDVVQRKVVWKTRLPETTRAYHLDLIGDNLYLASTRVFALSKEDGEVLWKSEGAPHNLERPVIVGNNIYIRDNENGLYMIDMMHEHKIIGKLLIKPSDESPSPAAVGDLLIVPFGDRRIYAYKP